MRDCFQPTLVNRQSPAYTMHISAKQLLKLVEGRSNEDDGQRVGVGAQDIAIGARDVGFDYRAGQISHSVANGTSPLRCFLGAVLSRCEAAEMGPTTRYTLRSNAAIIMKI